MLQVIVKEDSLSESDNILIKNLFGSVNITEYKLVNIKYWRIDTRLFSVLLGDFKTNLPADKKLMLPSLSKLYDQPGNEKSREFAYSQLVEYAKWLSINSESSWDIQDLPNLPVDKLIELEKDLKKTKEKEIAVLDVHGHKLHITVSKDSNPRSITFSELIAINLAKQAFGLVTKLVKQGET